MYDIKPLEEEWRKYHHRKHLSVYAGLLAFFLIASAIVWFLTREKAPIAHVVKESNVSKEVDATVKKTILKENPKIEKPVDVIVENIPMLENKEEQILDKPHKKIKLNIIDASSVDAYKDVEKRFHMSRNIEDSLFLAKTYFRKGNYKKSEYWALQTNKLDSTIDESWIVFVKSKFKTGHKNEAINILKKYIKRTGSEQAISVLNTIKKNN